MTFELLLSYASLILLLVFMLIYFPKLEFKNARTKCFKILVWLELPYILAEILSIFAQKYFAADILDMVFCKAHWIIGIIWFALLEFYFSTIIHNIKQDKIIDIFKSTLLNKVLGIFGIVFAIAYIFLPYETWNIDELIFVENLPGFAISGFFILIAIIIFSDLYKNKSTIDKDDRFTVIFTLCYAIVTMGVQLLFKNISFIPFGYLIILYSIYFNSEDPDIAISREINSAQTTIEQSNKTKTDFLSNMTFEIKTPMNLITSLCDDLRTMPTFDEATIREDIKQIQKSGNNLLDIINNVLDISKIETGKDIAQEKSYKINDLINDVVNVAKAKIGAKPVKLMVNIDQNISSMLSGDSSKLYQSLTNVVNNAAKYTEVGRITLTITSTKNNNVETLLFKVSDTGPGIKDEDKDKLFKKFERLDNATESEVEGSGLGLVITKQYIDTLGGKIWFESQYRVGTTFYIELAQKIVDPTPIGKAIEESANKEITEKLDCSQYVALIVDDNALNIKVAKRLLETYKFKVESFQSGKECVQAVKDEKHYDVIFMDHMMPEMDGIETLHVLKKLDGYQIPPVVALTANAIAGMKEMYLSEGFDEYLSKPINTNELDRIINKYFKK